MGEEGGQSKLFEDVVFTIITGPKLLQKDADELANLLVEHGGEERSIKEDERGLPVYQLDEITHIISPDIDFMGYNSVEEKILQQQRYEGQTLSGQVEEKMIAIVKPEWVTVSIARKKTQHVRAYNPDPSYFFSGIVATSAGLPDGDRDAIFGGISAMGGQYASGLTKFTTHLIALNVDHIRCQQAIEKKLPVKIVLPHWFDDCLKLGKRIDEGPYTLPNPDVTYDLSNDNPPFPEVKLEYTFESAKRPPKLKKTNQFLEGKKIFFAADVEVHKMLKETLKGNIQDAGGVVVEYCSEANVLICQWRDGEEYVDSMRRGLEVGNLTWLYWMMNKGEWASPLQRLLHYPKPKTPVPGMEHMKITVSNYGGDARLYIEALIEACGAEFTRSMKMENTHLITAKDSSEKCKAAREWNINMVNHLWLEESYAKYQAQSLTNQRYIFFPPRTNLMEVVGKTRIDPQALDQFYLSEQESDDTPPSTSDGNKVPISSLRIAASMTTAEQQSSATVNSSATETPKAAGKSAGGRGRGRPRGSSALAQTPVRPQAPTAEPDSVMSTGRRAKDKAVSKLHDTIMPDVMQFEKEKKRKGGVVYGGRRSSSPKMDNSKPGSAKKRALEEDDATSESDSKVKKQKQKSKKVKTTVFLLVTSHDAWANASRKEESDKKILRELGVTCIDNPEPNMTHLAAPKVLRTRKFVCGIAFAPTIVSTEWIQDCVDQKTLLDTKPYLLKSDKNLKLTKALERAKANDRKLLDGFRIYISPKVNGGFETYKDIVNANGGEAINFKAPRSGTINLYDSDKNGKENRLILLSTADEDKLNKGFKTIAQKMKWEPRVFETEWLLNAAMQQEITWDEEHSIS